MPWPGHPTFMLCLATTPFSRSSRNSSPTNLGMPAATEHGHTASIPMNCYGFSVNPPLGQTLLQMYGNLLLLSASAMGHRYKDCLDMPRLTKHALSTGGAREPPVENTTLGYPSPGMETAYTCLD